MWHAKSCPAVCAVRTHHSNIHCLRMVRVCAFKTPAMLHRPCSKPSSSTVVHSSVPINHSFVLNKHFSHYIHVGNVRKTFCVHSKITKLQLHRIVASQYLQNWQ